MPATRQPAQVVEPDPDIISAAPVVVVEPRHAIGCPESRVETFAARTPDGVPVTVRRCVECGEQVVTA